MDRKIVESLMQGKSVREVSKTFHAGKVRVRALREKAKEYGYLDGDGKKKGKSALPQYPHPLFPDPSDKRALQISDPHRLLDQCREWIEDRLEAGWHAITVFEELSVEVSRSSFYRYLEKHKIHDLGKSYRRVVPEIISEPGECLQLDWGKLRDVTDPKTGKKKTLWMFAGVLGFSRYRMVRLVWSNSVEETLAAIESMFKEIGGVPFKITSDNPKCFALKADKYDPLLNPAIERFASHYGTLMECLPPRDPQKKGKVERMMPHIRRLYEAHGDAWHGIEESQEYLDRKISIANQKRHGTTGLHPSKVFESHEKEKLKPLPTLAYAIEEYHEGVIRKDGHVRFKGKYYSLDEQYIEKEVVVLGSRESVSIFLKGKLLEVHEKIKNPHQSKSTKPHHLKPWERSMEDHSIYLDRAQKIGPDVKELIRTILLQGQGFIDNRKVWGILTLDKTHSNFEINKACEQAIELQSYSYRTVKSLLTLNQKPSEKKETIQNQKNGKAKQNRFVRPISEYEEQLDMILH
jgi:transposase